MSQDAAVAPEQPAAPSRRTRLRRIALRTGVAAASLVLALAAAEILIRIFDPFDLSYQTSWHFLLHEAHQLSDDPGLVWEQVPGYERRLPAYEVRISEQGLRADRVYDIPAPDDVVRVLCLGDSFTFGSGVNAEDTWVRLLEEELSSELGRPVETINAGVNGWNTMQQLAWLRERGLAFEPDAIVLFWVENDIEFLTGPENPMDARAQTHAFFRRDPNLFRRRVLHAAYEIAPGLTGLMRYALRLKLYEPVRHVRSGGVWDIGWFLSAQEPNVARNRDALAAMGELAEENDLPLIVTSWQRISGPEAFLAQEDIPYAPVLEAPSDEELRRLSLTPWDPHPNEEGHAQIAEQLSRELAPALD